MYRWVLCALLCLLAPSDEDTTEARKRLATLQAAINRALPLLVEYDLSLQMEAKTWKRTLRSVRTATTSFTMPLSAPEPPAGFDPTVQDMAIELLPGDELLLPFDISRADLKVLAPETREGVTFERLQIKRPLSRALPPDAPKSVTETWFIAPDQKIHRIELTIDLGDKRIVTGEAIVRTLRPARTAPPIPPDKALQRLRQYMPPRDDPSAPGAFGVSPDGRRLAVASPGGYFALREIEMGTEIVRDKTPSSAGRSLAFAPAASVTNKSLLAIGMQDGTLVFRDTTTGKERQSLTGHLAAVHQLAFAPDGRRLASADENGVIALWDTQSGRLKCTLRPETGDIRALRFLKAGQVLAVLTGKAEMAQYDVETGKLLSGGKPAEKPNSAAALRADGKRMALAYEQQIVLHDVDTGKTVRVLELPSPALQLQFVPGNRYLASLNINPEVETGQEMVHLRIWDTESGALIRSLNIELSAQFTFSPDGTILFVSDDDNYLTAWRVPASAPSPQPGKVNY